MGRLVWSDASASFPDAREVVANSPSMTVWLVEDAVNGGYAIRQWTNDGLEGGTHHLVPHCFALTLEAERDSARDVASVLLNELADARVVIAQLLDTAEGLARAINFAEPTENLDALVVADGAARVARNRGRAFLAGPQRLPDTLDGHATTPPAHGEAPATEPKPSEPEGRE